MEYTYTPHRELGGTVHFPSPTNPFTTNQLRRSVSRSPSKPAKLSLHTSSTSPSPFNSPSNLFSLRTTPNKMPDPVTTPRKKFSVRRLVTKSASRSARSPIRRVLSDASNKCNISRNNSPEERKSDDSDSSKSQGNSPPLFRFSAGGEENSLPHELTSRTTPMKRSDAPLNPLSDQQFGTPMKRRSLHATSEYASFHQSSPWHFAPYQQQITKELPIFTSFSSPAPKRAGPTRKSLNRQTQIVGRPRGFAESLQQSHTQSSPSSKSRNRLSLDHSFLSQQSRPAPVFLGSINMPPPTQLSRSNSSGQPHPLSNAIVPSSSVSSLTEDTKMSSTEVENSQMSDRPEVRAIFSKSLPIGALRPSQDEDSQSSQASSFATPAVIKSMRHQTGGFMSTGLISKRNRNPDYHPYNDNDRYNMPDTPSKRASYPPVTGTPFARRVQQESQTPFGDPATPLVNHKTRTPFDLFGRTSHHGNLFGPDIHRRTSFVSEDGEDNALTTQDSHSSADELPPTPTKHNGSGRKQNSLRSSLFGRRASLNPDTFSPKPMQPHLEASEQPKIIRRGKNAQASPAFKLTFSPVTPVQDLSGRSSPLTPQTSFDSHSPDQSVLNLSVFKASTTVIPPMTPTAQRDQAFNFQPAGTANDVDTSITSRFHSTSVIAQGEFSLVYRVTDPVNLRFLKGKAPPSPGSAWIVKKMKKPYIGPRDREMKLREVQILRQLRSQDHVLEYLDSWENEGRLYIQTEYCEDGSLANFLSNTGNKARLDDFRVWKILLELCMVR
jgi:mitosis inhibitor protein kinase SWE1